MFINVAAAIGAADTMIIILPVGAALCAYDVGTGGTHRAPGR